MTTIDKNKPIRVETPYAVLGKRPTVRYDVAAPAQLCADDINIWAKYKPVIAVPDTPRALTDEQRKAVNYGLVCSADAAAGVPLASAYQLGNIVWSYAAPTETVFKRLTDWLGYEPDAVPPVSPLKDIVIYSTDSELITTPLSTQVQTENNLRLSDFDYLAGKYLCLVIINADTNAVLAAITSTATLDNGATSVVYPISSGQSVGDLQFPAVRNKKYILCAADQQRLSPSAAISPRLYALPSAVPLIAGFAYSAASPWRFTFTGVSATNRRYPLSLSLYQLVEVGATPNYFQVSNGFWLYCTVENRTTSQQTLRPTDIRLRAAYNLSGNEVNFAPSAFHSPGDTTAQTAIVIAPGDSVDICFNAYGAAVSGGVTNNNIMFSADVYFVRENNNAASGGVSLYIKY